MVADSRAFIVQAVDQLQVVVDDMPDRRRLYDAQACHVAGHTPAKKILRPAAARKKRVVVEEYEPVGQPFDAVDIQFDGVRIECGEVLRRDEIPVIHDVQLGVVAP